VKRRWNRRPAKTPLQEPEGYGRSRAVKRRVLMVAIAVVTGIMLYVVSRQNGETGDGFLDGRATLDGEPFGGATIEFRAEERSLAPPAAGGKTRGEAISRYSYPARTDADGHYSVKLRPGMSYSILVRRSDKGKEPLQSAKGRVPSVEVQAGQRQFDIQLASKSPTDENTRR
jgi:hypothetical protein